MHDSKLNWLKVSAGEIVCICLNLNDDEFDPYGVGFSEVTMSIKVTEVDKETNQDKVRMETATVIIVYYEPMEVSLVGVYCNSDWFYKPILTDVRQILNLIDATQKFEILKKCVSKVILENDLKDQIFNMACADKYDLESY